MVEVRHLKRVIKSKRDASLEPPPTSAADDGRAPEQYHEDEGIIGLLTDLKFDLQSDSSLNCPSCGEEVVIDRGLCPKCHELIRAKDPYALEARVLPVIDAKNVVYVHFDVTNGDLRFVSRMSTEQKTEFQKIHIEGLSGEIPNAACNP